MMPDDGKYFLMEMVWRGGEDFFYADTYTNNITPNRASVFGDFVRPVMDPVLVLFPNAPVGEGDRLVYVTSSFSFTNWVGPFPFTVYGVIITFVSGSMRPIFHAVRLPSPVQILQAGDVITINKLTIRF